MVAPIPENHRPDQQGAAHIDGAGKHGRPDIEPHQGHGDEACGGRGGKEADEQTGPTMMEYLERSRDGTGPALIDGVAHPKREHADYQHRHVAAPSISESRLVAGTLDAGDRNPCKAPPFGLAQSRERAGAAPHCSCKDRFPMNALSVFGNHFNRKRGPDGRFKAANVRGKLLGEHDRF